MMTVGFEGKGDGLETIFPDGRRVRVWEGVDPDNRSNTLWAVSFKNEQNDVLEFAASHEAMIALFNMYLKLYARNSGIKVD